MKVCQAHAARMLRERILIMSIARLHLHQMVLGHQGQHGGLDLAFVRKDVFCTVHSFRPANSEGSPELVHCTGQGDFMKFLQHGHAALAKICPTQKSGLTRCARRINAWYLSKARHCAHGTKAGSMRGPASSFAGLADFTFRRLLIGWFTCFSHCRVAPWPGWEERWRR